MYLFNKILKVNIIKPSIKASIINGRGSIKEDFPSDFSEEEIDLIRSVSGITMTSYERLVSLLRSLDYLCDNGIEGDIVECGVWRGGSMALAARKLILMKQEHRKLYLFDTFEGMTPPTENDSSSINHIEAKSLLDNSNKFDGNNVWCYSTLDEVISNMNATKYPHKNISYFEGKVEETLPEESIGRIALLRLDTDWYESTKHELETLFDKLVPNGILIIDDYGHWSGARKAVDEFFAEREIPALLHRIDYTGRLYLKN